MIIESALLCLAINIYHESRGEPIMGQYGVALVTVNRAKTHDRVCHEVFRKAQFSWTSAVKKTPKGWHIPHHMLPREPDAWDKALIIARVTLDGRMLDVTRGATFYHANYVRPRWRLAMVQTKRIGAHIFYSLPA